MPRDAPTKVTFLGDAGVGKTCLCRAIQGRPYAANYRATAGVQFDGIELADAAGRRFHLNLWDTAGQEAYKSIVPMFLNGTDIVLLCCDVSCASSLSSLAGWAELVRQSGARENVAIFAIGCKADSPEWAFSPDSIVAVGGEINARHVLVTSARTGDGIGPLRDLMLEVIASQLRGDGLKETNRRGVVVGQDGAERDGERGARSGCCG